MSSQPAPRGGKLLQYVNWRLRVTVTDTRHLIGTFLAFDKHMNIVLADTEEIRKLKPLKGETEERIEKRTLGLVLLRGENVVAVAAEAPPQPKPKASALLSRAAPPPASRTAPPPQRGVGIAAGASMLPQTRAAVPAPFRSFGAPGFAPPPNQFGAPMRALPQFGKGPPPAY